MACVFGYVWYLSLFNDLLLIFCGADIWANKRRVCSAHKCVWNAKKEHIDIGVAVGVSHGYGYCLYLVLACV